MAQPPGQVAVLGSMVVDFPLRLPRGPVDGETLIADEAGIFPGGKGLNQAVGLRRLGLHPIFLGQVGSDPFGQYLISVMRTEHVAAVGVMKDPRHPTGAAIPVIEPERQYILHVSGSNHHLDPNRVVDHLEQAGPVDLLLIQAEVNREANLAAALWVKDRGGQVVLDPSPVSGVGDDLLFVADYLTPNAVELAALTRSQTPETMDEAALMADLLLSRHPGIRAVVATLGPWGAYGTGEQGTWRVSAEPVITVDPTAAGDAFNAAFCWALLQGMSLQQATWYGVRAGTHAVQILGAIPSLPRLKDLGPLPRRN